MANEEHLALLKRGVVAWNEWREHHPKIVPDLSNIDLRNRKLIGVNLLDANLSGSTLNKTNLRDANLHNANLYHSNLNSVILDFANLSGADLSNANLSGAFLRYAILSEAKLNGTNLSNAHLRAAYLDAVTMDNANLRGATVSHTVFAHVDLGQAKGLTELKHRGPSFIELHTIQLPQNGSALHFLRGAGVPDAWIDDYLARMMHPIQYFSCFISYSSHDEMLARRLHADLQDRGVRCWFAPEDMKIGDKIRSRIDEAIHLQDKLLLLLSTHALASDWVGDEVEAALEKERRQGREVLFPVRLDESVMQASQAWAAKLRRQRHIGDFTNWTDPQAYKQAFERLLRDLKAENDTKGERDGK